MNRKRFITTLIASASVGRLIANPPPALTAQQQRQLAYCVHPEPRAMRSGISRVFGGELRTVFNLSKYQARTQRLESYTEKEFQKLGIGWESFYQRAQQNADAIFATLQPVALRASEDPKSPIEGFVFAGEEAWYSSLMISPSLQTWVSEQLGSHFIAAAPTQHALYVFLPKPEVLQRHAGTLLDLHQNSPFAASEEFFSIKIGSTYPSVVGNFSGR